MGNQSDKLFYSQVDYTLITEKAIKLKNEQFIQLFW